MPINCPQCSYENPDQSTFCVRCGSKLQSDSQDLGTANSFSQPTYVASTPGSFTPPSYSSPSSPSFPPSPTPSFSASAQSSAAYAAPVALPTQMGMAQGQYTLRHAFAGHGTLIMHYSWLLNGKQIQATTVRSTILDIVRRRNIAGVTANAERLTDSSVDAETRDYLTVQRKGSTVFIYAAPAGQDLYISRATMVLPPISLIRVLILGLMLFIVFFSPSIIQSTITGMLTTSSGLSGIAGGGILALLIPLLILSAIFALSYIPILFILIVLLIRSIIVWALEKDFWMYLRSNYLNDFQVDDIMVLEHATDDTVRTAVEQLGLDATQIVPPSQGYQPKKRVRII